MQFMLFIKTHIRTAKSSENVRHYYYNILFLQKIYFFENLTTFFAF